MARKQIEIKYFSNRVLSLLAGSILFSCTFYDSKDLSLVEKEITNIVFQAQRLDSLAGDSLFEQTKWVHLDSLLSQCLEESAEIHSDEHSKEATKSINSKVNEYIRLRLKATENLIQIRMEDAIPSRDSSR